MNLKPAAWLYEHPRFPTKLTRQRAVNSAGDVIGRWTETPLYRIPDPRIAELEALLVAIGATVGGPAILTTARRTAHSVGEALAEREKDDGFTCNSLAG